MQDNNPNPDQIPQPDNTPDQTTQPIMPPAEPLAVEPTPAPVPTPTPTPVPTPGLTPAPKKSKKGLIILLSVVAVLLIAAGATAAYLLLRPSSNKTGSTTDNTTSTNQTDTQASTDSQNGTKTTTFGYDGANISVQHPASWKVETTSGSPSGDTVPSVSITSDKGNVLHMFIPNGIGGTCTPDNTAYTATHVIATATPDVYFIQYEYSLDSKNYTDLTIQQFTDGAKVPNEGDTGTDICSNLPHYSTVMSGKTAVLVNVGDSTNKNAIGSNLNYDQISSDADFMTMLKSLKVE